MAPKTRFAGKTNKEGAPEKKKKNESAAEKKKVAAEKKKVAAEKKKAAAVKRRREAVKKKEMQQRRRLKPQKRRGSKTRLRRSLHPIQPSAPDRIFTRTTFRSRSFPAPSAELLSQDDREGTPSPSFPIEPQKAPTQTPKGGGESTRKLQ
ncbi:unnamed protein product [Brassica napus]|uniref:(rape) hypothetical protein n=1 Tax=Brassica napus TaxID=3708 RepID=A0A816KS02_BRANA|nr:unnamed protein product [Brassica napus]